MTDRRTFGKTVIAGALSSALAAARPLDTWAPGIKMSLQVGSDPNEEILNFVKQLGIEWVNINTFGKDANLENFKRQTAKVTAAGLKVWNIGNGNVHNMEEVTLNLPGRDKKIEEYLQYLRNCAAAGVYYTTYAHMGNGIWSTAPEKGRGGMVARGFDLSKADKGDWVGKQFKGPLTHGRKYSQEEIWENYSYFIKKVVPVAEALGVRIGIHPDDPPVPELGGIPRCIFGNFDGYRKALEMANSPNIGMCLCVGCWLEGGPQMGKDVVETIRYFGKQKKLFKVHFRNVTAPLPHFVETMMDNGYMNMYKVMRALKEVDYRGCIIADHIPGLVGGPWSGMAYSAAYMRALLERANEEFAGKRT